MAFLSNADSKQRIIPARFGADSSNAEIEDLIQQYSKNTREW
jgi:hypothetical protein